MDNRKNNGGHSTKGFAGRKPKCDEIAMIEKLTPMLSKAYEALEKGVEAGDFKFVQLYFNYYAGKPKETRDLNVNQEQPIFYIGEE
jgi:hypothetical protein